MLMAGVALMGTRAWAEESPPQPSRRTGDTVSSEQLLQKKLGKLDGVNDEIRGLEKRLAELRTAWRNTRARLDRDLGRVRRRVDMGKDKLAALCMKTAKKKGELAELKAAEKDHATMTSRLSSVADIYFAGLTEKVGRGIPWRRRQRLDAMAKARDVLKDDNPNPLSVLSAVERIQKREESLGRITESGTVRVERQGKKIEVQAFHLGRLGVIFADKEGTFGAFAGPGQTLEQGIESSKKHPRAVSTYVRAIDILFKRRAPHVANLFLPGLVIRNPGERK
jgi:hypothetical protein